MGANNSSIYIDKIIQRLNKSDLSDTNMRDIILVFPASVNGKSVKALKRPKTRDSVRRVFLPNSVAGLLLRHKAAQDEQKAFLGSEYNDYGLVIAQSNGNPIEVKDMSKRFASFVNKSGLRKVDFYSLRHASVTAKLRATHDVKAVQGDTGHVTADMIHNVYAGILDEDRINTAVAMEDRVFSKVAPPAPSASDGAVHSGLHQAGRLYVPDN